MDTIANDPLPWVTEALERAGAFERTLDEVFDYRNNSYNDRDRVSNLAAAALLDVLSNTVAALHDDEKAYRVVLNQATATAGTMLERRIVEVGSAPMNDDDLTDGQKASVMMGLALHEVGHIRFSRAYKGAITRLFGAGKVTGAISTLSNLAADCHDEAEAMLAFPGLAPTIAVTLWWVGGKGDVANRPLDLEASVQERVNAAIAATRYPWQVDWTRTPERAAWLEWWTDWAKRARHSGQPKVHAEVVKEAIEKVRDFTPTPPQQEPEPPEPPQGTPEPGDGQPDTSDDEQGSKPDPDGDDGQGSDPAKTIASDEDAEEGDDGASEGNGDDASESDDDADATPTGEQGGLGDEQGVEDYMAELDKAMDEEAPMDDPCVKDAAKDEDNDTMLQQGADHVSRGKREGMRTRKYHHSSSTWGAYKQGRTVASIPRKGKRWVYDT